MIPNSGLEQYARCLRSDRCAVDYGITDVTGNEDKPDDELADAVGIVAAGITNLGDHMAGLVAAKRDGMLHEAKYTTVFG